jgi:hypothetical protein
MRPVELGAAQVAVSQALPKQEAHLQRGVPLASSGQAPGELCIEGPSLCIDHSARRASYALGSRPPI